MGGTPPVSLTAPDTAEPAAPPAGAAFATTGVSNKFMILGSAAPCLEAFSTGLAEGFQVGL